MKSILLLKRKEINNQYAQELFEALIEHKQFFIQKTNELVIPTNVQFKQGGDIFDAFNKILYGLYRQQTIQIRVEL